MWITAFCKSWRREEARLASRWNAEGCKQTERERPQFRGQRARGFYSAEGEFVDVEEDDRLVAAALLLQRFTPADRLPRIVLSYMAILPLVFGVMVGVVALLAYRSFLQVTCMCTCTCSCTCTCTCSPTARFCR